MSLNPKLGITSLRRSNGIAKTNLSEKRTLKAMLNNAYQQNQSPFLQRLPSELRLIIYAFVFLSQTVHVMARGGRKYYTMRGLPIPVGGRLPELMSLPCKLELEDVSYTPGVAPCFDILRCYGIDVIVAPCRCQPLAIGGLVRACRLLYVESVSLLYTNTSFAFNCTHNFNVFCKATSLNRQFAPPPLMFIRDIRISVPGPNPEDIRDINAGLTLLTEQAVNLKRFEVVVKHTGMDLRDTRADILCGERRRLLEETFEKFG
jgi:hypothetical protein